MLKDEIEKKNIQLKKGQKKVIVNLTSPQHHDNPIEIKPRKL
jgi:hypothetical protein